MFAFIRFLITLIFDLIVISILEQILIGRGERGRLTIGAG